MSTPLTQFIRLINEGFNAGDLAVLDGQPPTGRPFAITVIDIARFVDGRMVEHWGVPDRLGLLLQLGLLPGLPRDPRREEASTATSRA